MKKQLTKVKEYWNVKDPENKDPEKHLTVTGRIMIYQNQPKILDKYCSAKYSWKNVWKN